MRHSIVTALFAAARGSSAIVGPMNRDVRMLVADAERALAERAPAAASSRFVEAGDTAAQYGLWRGAMRCYRSALEVDLVCEPAIARAIHAVPHTSPDAVGDWTEYQLAARQLASFTCRGAEVTIDDRGAFLTCPAVGPVFAIAMPERDLVEAAPAPGFADLPLAMAMIVLRRGLFIAPCDHSDAPRTVRIAYARRQVSLSELGEWTRV